MSTIGRIFLVLNLIAAGVFVGFAGTFLKNQDNYKQQLTEVREDLQIQLDSANSQLDNAKDEANRQNNTNSGLNAELVAAKNRASQLDADNQALQNRLSELEGTLKRLQSNYSTVADQIEAATNQSTTAFQMAMSAQNEKDEAVRSRDAAQAALATAERNISELERSVEAREASLADLEKVKNELDLLVSVARTKGFLDDMAVPSLKGVVSFAEGPLVTVQVTDNPAEASIKPGYRFAIYADSVYKGDMVVNEVQDNFAMGRILNPVQGRAISVGDQAATQLN